jgi:Ca2+-binding RTX toxin-like protein
MIKVTLLWRGPGGLGANELNDPDLNLSLIAPDQSVITPLLKSNTNNNGTNNFLIQTINNEFVTSITNGFSFVGKNYIAPGSNNEMPVYVLPDYIEQIYITNPTQGDYKVVVSGNLNTASYADFSIFFTSNPSLVVGKGHGWGDIHLVTFDGQGYNYQGFGDHIFVKSLIDDFQVQTRQESWPTNTATSVTTAFATTIDGYNVVYKVGQGLKIDGQTFNLPNGETFYLGNSQIKRQDFPNGVGEQNGVVDLHHPIARYTFTYAGPDGLISTSDDDVVTVDDTYWSNNRDGFLSVYVDPADYRSGQLQGLLGDGDGNASNDYTKRDGTQSDSYSFARDWIVTPQESLFGSPTSSVTTTLNTVANNLNTALLVTTSVPSEPISLETLAQTNPEAVAQAFALAREIGIPDGYFLNGAVFDYVATGEDIFLQVAKQAADFVLENTPNTPNTLGEIDGIAWNDSNGDGIWDTGEQALAGWTVYIDSVNNGQLDPWELSTVTDVNGQYTFTNLGTGEYNIREVLQTGWQQTSSPASVILGAGETLTDINFGNASIPTITLAVSPNSITEDGSDQLRYTFTRTGDITNALTVNYTIGGSATNGEDYANIGTSVTFSAGNQEATVTVTPNTDTTSEPNETVTLTLASGTDYTIGTTNTATGTITNDDLPYITLSVSPSSVTENGSTNLVYTFTCQGGLIDPFSPLYVYYTIGGTATYGSDYTSNTSFDSYLNRYVVYFDGSSDTATVVIDPTSDATIESDETVTLTLRSDYDYAIGTSTPVTGTITDVPPNVIITQSGGDTKVTEGGITDSYTVVLKNQPTGDVSIALNGGSQLSLSVNNLTFTPSNWDVAQTVTVTAINDTIGEGPHTGTILHTVTSTDPAYNGGAVQTIVASITDNDIPTGPRRYVQQTGTANPFNGFDTGFFSSPTLADIDADGDLDLFAGKYDYGSLEYYKNLGTATVPNYVAQVGFYNPFQGIMTSYNNKTPILADIDGDSDLDAINGEFNGTLAYYKNTGTPTNPTLVIQTGVTNPFNGIDFNGTANGGLSEPALADIDGNGTLDLIIGGNDGTLKYYKNTGSVTNPNYIAQTGTANPFDGIDIGNFSSPTFADIDGNGTLDLIMGEDYGNIFYYKNIGTTTAPVFVAQTGINNPFNAIDVGQNASPTFGDVNGDGSLDMVIGELFGNFIYYLNLPNQAPTITSSSTVTFAENLTGTIIKVTATDPDPNTTLTYSLEQTGDWQLFGINSTTGNVFRPFGASFDFENPADSNKDNVYNITVVASDGSLTTSQAIAITITNVDEQRSLILTPQQDIFNNEGLDDTVTGTFANLQQQDSIKGGTGIDTLVITEGTTANAVTINASSTTNQFNITGTTINSFERFDLSGFLGKVTYTGTTANDWVATGAGADVLNGGAGLDTLIGGLGNDTYTVDNVSDIVTEMSTLATEIDTVSSSVTYTLSANVEKLTLTGTTNINGTGNTLANTITGNTGKNLLDGGDGNDNLNGGAGIDTLIGGVGNDIFVVDTITDLIDGGVGIDIVQSSVTFSLANALVSNIENLTLTGTAAINGTGNTLDNTITGNTGNNILDGGDGNDSLNGGAGIDTLIGGIGNDIFIVDTITDVINGGVDTDTIQSSITFSLSNALISNVENLTLTGTAAINGTGNALNNILTGNAAINILDGGAGVDILIGGLGNDTYTVDNVGDIVTETSTLATEIDTVNSSVTYTLSANVEKLTLTGTANINGTGNALANTITGNTDNNILDGGNGNDRLNGGAGIDTLIGGLGNDIYTVDNVGDIVTETSTLATEIDTVNSSVTYTLSANVEKLTLTGTANIDGTGNTLANTITGNSGNNILIGNEGNDILTGNSGSDILVGGTGNDTLNLGPNDGVSDLVRYASGDGTDIINQFIKGIDKLAFTGIGFIDVKVSGTSTQLRLSDGIQANPNFGTGTLLATISGVTGFTSLELGLGGTSLDSSNTATFLFA